MDMEMNSNHHHQGDDNNNKDHNDNDVVMMTLPPLNNGDSTAEEDIKPITRPAKIVITGTDDSHNKHPTTNNNNNNHKDSEILELELDPEEQELLEVIVQAANAMTTNSSKPSPQVRVAGGWVRDKLLGLKTHDVDIAVDTCTGVEFATWLKEYLHEKEDHEPHHHKKTKSCGKIGVIAANPAQSKHLETATMKVFGLEVDFCNLRAETYGDSSRIPTMQLGTPLEDAYRRDFTMNALYYNCHSRVIEDWTKRGLLDLLETKQVTTPLQAYQTFHDDPLRVLRAIRFAVRYEMRLSDELQDAAMHPQIHQELHRKVSRERVGKELEGMLSGKHSNPIQALKLICNLKLAGSVFCLPPDEEHDVPIFLGTIGQRHLEPIPYMKLPNGTTSTAPTTSEEESHDKSSSSSSSSSSDHRGQLRQVAWEESRECLRVLPKLVQSFPRKNNDSTSSSSQWDSRLLYLAVVLLPYEHLQYVEKPVNKQHQLKQPKIKHAIEYIFREGIKFKNKDVQAMVTMVENLDGMVQLLKREPTTTRSSDDNDNNRTDKPKRNTSAEFPIRLEVGLLLRATKEWWVTLLIVATVSLVRKASPLPPKGGEKITDHNETSEGKEHHHHHHLHDDDDDHFRFWQSRAIEWHRIIMEDLLLDECWKTKPLMNGKEIMQHLGLSKGPNVGTYTEALTKWMLLNPHGTLQDCQGYLKEFQKEQEFEQDQAAQHISKKMHL